MRPGLVMCGGRFVAKRVGKQEGEEKNISNSRFHVAPSSFVQMQQCIVDLFPNSCAQNIGQQETVERKKKEKKGFS